MQPADYVLRLVELLLRQNEDVHRYLDMADDLAGVLGLPVVRLSGIGYHQEVQVAVRCRAAVYVRAVQDDSPRVQRRDESSHNLLHNRPNARIVPQPRCELA